MQEADLTRQPTTDPTPIYRYRDGIYAADLLATALVFLDFFTWLHANPSDLRQICRHFEIQPRPTDVMLTLFNAMGLTEVSNGRFQLTALGSEHLVRSSPWYLGPYYASLKDRPVCKDFLVVLRSGKPANWGSFKDEKSWAQAMEEPSFANQFTAAMDCRGVYLGAAVAKAVDLTGRSSLLDIAGGSGIYACAMVAAHAHLRATVFEKPPVDKVATNSISNRGHGDRVRVVAGDMFKDPLPTGHDVHLFSNVLHDWDEPEVLKLLESSHGALPRGGMLIIHDAHISADKTGPLHVAEYSALLMHATEGKCYSLTEMQQYLSKTGFVEMRYRPTAASRSIITALKPG